MVPPCTHAGRDVPGEAEREDQRAGHLRSHFIATYDRDYPNDAQERRNQLMRLELLGGHLRGGYLRADSFRLSRSRDGVPTTRARRSIARYVIATFGTFDE